MCEKYCTRIISFLNLHSFYSWAVKLRSSQMRLFSFSIQRTSECKFTFTVNVNFPSFFYILRASSSSFEWFTKQAGLSHFSPPYFLKKNLHFFGRARTRTGDLWIQSLLTYQASDKILRFEMTFYIWPLIEVHLFGKHSGLKMSKKVQTIISILLNLHNCVKK